MTLKIILNKLLQAADELTAKGAVFEIAETEINGQTLPVYNTIPDNLRGVYESCIGHDKRTFLVYHQQRLSFVETYQLAANFAAALEEEFDIEKGDRVAIAMRNNPEWIIAFMAITAMGAIAVPMNGWWTGEELKYGLEDCGAKLAVVDNQRLERISPFADDLGIRQIVVSSEENSKPNTEIVFNFNRLVAAYSNETMPTVEILPEDDATILYTSGSSGHPKGVVSTQRSILTTLASWTLLGAASGMAEQKPDNIPPPEDAVALLTVPLFHVTGCHSLFLMSLIIGRTLVMMHKWDPQQALALIEEEGVTYFNGVPTMSQELLDAAENTEHDISTLTDLGSGGAARPAEHVRRISESFKINPSNGYGLTETNGIGAVNGGQTYVLQPDSVGIPAPSVTSIRLVDEAGNVQETGERGEICIRSAANARCYWNNPKATEAAFIDGWFHTGDVGYLDELGMLFIVDRIKDIIIRGGENISCSEVESAIYAHEGVAEVAVFALPDDRLGEIVGAVIYLKSGISLTPDQVREFLEQHLASYKIPADISISATPLPRTATEKILKREVKQQRIEALSTADA
ncbi:MAG: AMP-binding protein [Pseudomonadales bacterium]